MAQLTVNQLISAVESALGWPYKSPGSNDSSGIDCSGLLVYAFRKNGSSSIYHGSNTIYRKYCSAKGKLTSVSQLQPGMVVFKWNSNTPAKFADNLGDFQHIGVVTSVNPLRIVHASSAVGCVTTDTKIGKWKYWGWLKDVVKEGDEIMGTIDDKMIVPHVRIISPGGKVNIRKGNGTNYGRIASVAPGTLLELIGTAINGWYAVKYGSQIGWVAKEYGEIIGG